MGVVDPRHCRFRIPPWPSIVARMFGTRVAETILASVHVRAHSQAGHMDARSDPLPPLRAVPWGDHAALTDRSFWLACG